jgi:hypothetical protein
MVAAFAVSLVFAAAVVCDDRTASDPIPAPTIAPTSVKASSIFLVTNMSKISFIGIVCYIGLTTHA